MRSVRNGGENSAHSYVGITSYLVLVSAKEKNRRNQIKNKNLPEVFEKEKWKFDAQTGSVVGSMLFIYKIKSLYVDLIKVF